MSELLKVTRNTNTDEYERTWWWISVPGAVIVARDWNGRATVTFHLPGDETENCEFLGGPCDSPSCRDENAERRAVNALKDGDWTILAGMLLLECAKQLEAENQRRVEGVRPS